MTKSVRLWRAAPVQDPWMGFGSYWTRSEDFAHRFRLWVEGTCGTPSRVYVAEVELTDPIDFPFGVFLDPVKVTRNASAWAARYRWISFYEKGPFEGRMIHQYVYLGQDPISVSLSPPVP